MGKTGIIGGSALYAIEGLEIEETIKVRTPFGDPSDEAVIGKLAGRDVVFMPRHMKNHSLLPTEINFRANIYAFKVLGVDRLMSVSAVGSLKEEIRPMDIVLPDQFIDRTNQGRSTTFFGDGIVAHIAFAEPVCGHLKKVIFEANSDMGGMMRDGGTYINMEGPAFSTRAESLLYKSWGGDIIGMTNIQEARLAREAGICYATVAMVTDYDCWHDSPGVEAVSAGMVMENLARNSEAAGRIIIKTLEAIPERRNCACGETLRDAIITRKDTVPVETLEKLKPIIEGFI